MSKNHGCNTPENDKLYHLTENEIHTNNMYGHGFYTFFLNLEEDASCFINKKKYLLKEGMLVLLRPIDEVLCLSEDTKQSKNIRLDFRSDVTDALFSFLGQSGEKFKEKLLDSSTSLFCILSEREKKRIVECFERLKETEGISGADSELSLRFLVAELFSLFTQKVHVEKAEREEVPAWLENVCNKMTKHENFSEGLIRMMELSGKSREHLARSMQKYKNMTVSAYINNLRLDYVANMLLHTESSIVDLCYESGFSSLDYFGKQFKKKYGMSPSQFRNSMKNETT